MTKSEKMFINLVKKVATRKSKQAGYNLSTEKTVRKLILYNDDVNLFDYVVDKLMEVCGHTPEQAEQCALIAHYKGLCVVKTGNLEEMQMLKQQLISKGLQADIE